ncbi:hypothetical protein PG985_010109 [Apiospora marii]|uniref:uncharacterized protein n=1 Tax=Apiospora marii TaxID=335849 RepID=UPI00312DF036
MSGISKPLTKPQIKRLAQTLSPAAAKSMKIDLSLYDWRDGGRALSRLSNQANRSSRQRKTSVGGPHPPRQQFRTGVQYLTRDEDDLSLARSDVPLPGDGGRDGKSTPRLERQEAFRGISVGGGFVSFDNVVENDADLYRLGLLYDDGDKEGNFHLNDIVHDEPIYAVRLSRRKQKGGKNSNARMFVPGTPMQVIYESMEDSLYSMSPSLLEGYGFGGEDEGEDWSFIPPLVPHGSRTTADTVSFDQVTTPSTEAWVVLDGA